MSHTPDTTPKDLMAESTERLVRKKTITGVLALPLFFLIALPALFVGLMHSPTPHSMDVAVIGSQQSAGALIDSLKTQAGDAFEFSRASTVADAKEQVKQLDIRGAYDPATGTIYVASGDGNAAKTVVTGLFTPVAASAQLEATVTDLIPLDKADPLGTSALYVGLGAIVSGMLAGLLLGLFPTSTKIRVVGVIAVPLIATVIEVLYGWALFDVFPGNGLAPGLMIFALSLVTAVVTLGGTLRLGPAMLFVSLLFLVLMAVTTSGLAIPLDMAPSFYGAMHNVLPTAQGLESLRRLIYVDGYTPGWTCLTMGIWAAAGVALAISGTLRSRKAATVAAEVAGHSAQTNPAPASVPAH